MADLRELIDAHRAAVLADELNFDADGQCRDSDAAERSLTACNDSLRALIDAPCRTFADVMAKVEYFVSAKDRDHYDVMREVVDMVFPDGGDTIDGARRLLRSLTEETQP
ncbi:MAG: hypothetical protein ACTHOP_07585 [Mesorhizobium sp.]